MYGLIGAMSVEVEALMAQLEDRQEKQIGMDVFVSGKLFGKDAVLAVCGPGKINAALCAQSMILHYQPEKSMMNIKKLLEEMLRLLLGLEVQFLRH